MSFGILKTELGDVSIGLLKLGNIGNMSFWILKKSEVSLGILNLGDVRFRTLKLGNIGKMGSGILKLGEVSFGIFFVQIHFTFFNLIRKIRNKSGVDFNCIRYQIIYYKKKSKRSLTNIVNSGDVDSWHFFVCSPSESTKIIFFNHLMLSLSFLLAP